MPWSWFFLSKDPNLESEFVEKFIGKDWDLYSLSNNPNIDNYEKLEMGIIRHKWLVRIENLDIIEGSKLIFNEIDLTNYIQGNENERLNKLFKLLQKLKTLSRVEGDIIPLIEDFTEFKLNVNLTLPEIKEWDDTLINTESLYNIIQEKRDLFLQHGNEIFERCLGVNDLLGYDYNTTNSLAYIKGTENTVGSEIQRKFNVCNNKKMECRDTSVDDCDYNIPDLTIEEETCAICLENLPGITPFNCEHEFHEECISTLRSCPMCKKPSKFGKPRRKSRKKTVKRKSIKKKRTIKRTSKRKPRIKRSKYKSKRK